MHWMKQLLRVIVHGYAWVKQVFTLEDTIWHLQLVCLDSYVASTEMLSLKCLTAICRQARHCLHIQYAVICLLLCLIKIMICFLKHKSTLSRPLWTYFPCEGTLWPGLPTSLHSRLFWQPVNLYYSVLSCIQCHYLLFKSCNAGCLRCHVRVLYLFTLSKLDFLI